MTSIRTNLVLALLLTTAMPLLAEESPPPAPQPPAKTDVQLTLDDLRTFTDVFNQVRKNFIEKVDDHTLMNAAIRGMLSELDPHSAFMEADEFRDLENTSQGRYSGIGVELLIRDQHIVVVKVMDDGAASAAGIVSGDIITAIDHQDLRGHNLQAAISGLRGEIGSKVLLTIKHANGEVSEYPLTRAYVNVNSVFSRLVDGDFGYLRINHFTSKTAEEFKQQIETLQNQHPEPLQGIILDLRNNPGGVLKPAVTIADGFLDDGLIVYTHGRAANQLEYSAQPGQWQAGVPIVVLVNRSSASASEVLAGALQDRHRALIVGERTFGKGSVQSVLKLRNGAGIRLTTSRYYTPSGRSIQAEGIQPDIEIAPVKVIARHADEHQREADLDHHLNNEIQTKTAIPHSDVSAKDDYMMYQALILLKGARILNPDSSPAKAMPD